MNDHMTELLLSFQQVTGLDNVPRCKELLEYFKWNLESAVDYFLSVPLEDKALTANGSACPNNPNNTHSNQSFGRLLHFSITYEGTVYQESLPHHCLVGDIKTRLKEKTHIPESRMSLTGWKDKDDSEVFDTDTLRELQLPSKNELTLKKTKGMTKPQHFDRTPIANPLLKETFELHIHYHTEVYIVQYPGTKTIGQIKQDVVEITCPCRRQHWQGWPLGVKEEVTLAESGVNYPVHKLTVSDKFAGDGSQTTVAGPPAAKSRTSHRTRKHCDQTGNGDVEEMLKNDDDVDDKHLIADSAADQVKAIEQFCVMFRNRFAETHPEFHVSSFDDVINKYLLCDAKQRKPVAFYLHCDCNVDFCKDVLCNTTTIHCLDGNYVVWPCDLTRKANRITFARHIREPFQSSSLLAKMIEDSLYDTVPSLLVAWCVRGSSEIVSVIRGDITLIDLTETLCTRLMEFESMNKIDIEQEEVQSRVVDEPDEHSGDSTVFLKIRCPDGAQLQRRFRKSSSLQDLQNFVVSKGYHVSQYRIVTNCPKRSLSNFELDRSLGDLELATNVLFIEEIFS